MWNVCHQALFWSLTIVANRPNSTVQSFTCITDVRAVGRAPSFEAEGFLTMLSYLTSREWECVGLGPEVQQVQTLKLASETVQEKHHQQESSKSSPPNSTCSQSLATPDTLPTFALHSQREETVWESSVWTLLSTSGTPGGLWCFPMKDSKRMREQENLTLVCSALLLSTNVLIYVIWRMVQHSPAGPMLVVIFEPWIYLGSCPDLIIEVRGESNNGKTNLVEYVSFIWFIESAEHAVITAVRSAELV